MIFRSPYPDVEIPDVPLTPFVLQRAGALGHKPALIDGPSGHTLTYVQLADDVSRVAASLARRGLRKGDVFAILSPNVPEYALGFLAVATLGGISTPLNPLYTADEVAYQLRDANARYMLTTPALLDKHRQVVSESPVEQLFVLGEGEGATPFAELLESDGRVQPVRIDPANDVVALPYSSGTTGLPKGVMLTHRNLVANMRQMEAVRHVTGSDTLVCVLPLFHIYGMSVIMCLGLHCGATIVTMPRYDQDALLGIMQEHGVTVAHLVPPIVLMLAKHPSVEQYDLSRLRVVFSGAAPLGAELSRACSERLGCLVQQGYGMTEASPATHCSPFDPSSIKPGSIGYVLPNTECKVVDLATGQALGPGAEGELWVRGPQVMKGYLNRPDATAQTLNGDGWLRTGDVGYADADGHFFIVDRAKELIKYKGLQVAPAELEAVLLSHPDVADAAVIPSPDVEAGEVPKAFIVARGEGVRTDEVMAFVAERVAPHKRIRVIEVIDKIPKSASGKILRRILVERERAKRGAAVLPEASAPQSVSSR